MPIKPLVVILNGFPGAGKDTFVEICQKFAKVDQIHTSDQAKAALKIMGWDGEKTPEARALLATLVEKSYEIFDDAPIRYAASRVIRSDADIFFIHVREPIYIDKFKEEFKHHKASTLFIFRGVPEDLSNEADKNVLFYDYDYRISNIDSLRELEIQAKMYLQKLTRNITQWR